jgi:hypothetical protein
MFILDDTSSMWNCWSEVCDLVQTLAYLVKNTDDDGLDIVRANDPHNRLNSRRSSALVKFTEQAKPVPNLPSNLYDCLKVILPTMPIQEPFPKRWSIYILTNADWKGKGPACKIDEPIRAFINKLGPGVDSPIGIQFIYFGSNPKAKNRLEFLDNLPDVLR